MAIVRLNQKRKIDSRRAGGEQSKQQHSAGPLRFGLDTRKECEIQTIVVLHARFATLL